MKALTDDMRRRSPVPAILIAVLLIGPLVTAASAQTGSDRIRLNQIGFYPEAPKRAVVVDAPAGQFDVIDEATGTAVFVGILSGETNWSLSGEDVRIADFSGLVSPGTYHLVVPGAGESHSFEIADAVHRNVARGTLKAYYYQRVSTDLAAPYAGTWARPAGHPDTEVLVHASAATDARPEGTVISAPKGWYDAGDFNKYIVNSGISTYTLLALYEHYPEFASGLGVNIPESGNGVPDVLDETLWNLRWMLSMQDPGDGGVYHKLTHAGFQGAVMPHVPTAPRYVVQKSTPAALDLAAVAAQAARVFDGFDRFPGLADSLRSAAIDAWRWARAHPGVAYRQSEMNQQFDPDIVTGEYGGSGFGDEFSWAASELYITTGADSFLTAVNALSQTPGVPSWGDVRALGWYSLLHHEDLLDESTFASLESRFLGVADGLVEDRDEAPYHVSMGGRSWDFVWGSNSTAANHGMLLMQAFRLTGEEDYLTAAIDALDYLLGRNATSYSFVTGFGDKAPRNPHHRASEADGIDDPVPGFLVGGPNPGQQDNCAYPSDEPARSYTDLWCSYASNEVTINWNAPILYLASAIEATAADFAFSVAREPAMDIPASPSLGAPYPNPAAGELTVRINVARSVDVSVDFLDLLGRRVGTGGDHSVSAGRDDLLVPVADLPDGSYFVRIRVGDATFTRPFVKIGG